MEKLTVENPPGDQALPSHGSKALTHPVPTLLSKAVLWILAEERKVSNTDFKDKGNSRLTLCFHLAATHHERSSIGKEQTR